MGMEYSWPSSSAAKISCEFRNEDKKTQRTLPFVLVVGSHFRSSIASLARLGRVMKLGDDGGDSSEIDCPDDGNELLKSCQRSQLERCG